MCKPCTFLKLMLNQGLASSDCASRGGFRICLSPLEVVVVVVVAVTVASGDVAERLRPAIPPFSGPLIWYPVTNLLLLKAFVSSGRNRC